jgi:tellurite methyltransferase
MVGFHLDQQGEWVAELDCGHQQHVRHRPPFQIRPWVLDAGARASKLGAPLDCPLCERAEAPDGLRLVRRGPLWDGRSIPAGLLREHKLSPGTWGRLAVRSGRVTLRASTSPPIDRVLVVGAIQDVPPGVAHMVELDDAAQFSLELWRVVPRDKRWEASESEP